MEKGLDHSKFIIQRYDNYINGANTKGNFLLAFNTFLIGSLINNYCELEELVHTGWAETTFIILVCALIFSALTATVFIIKAVYPFLSSGNSSSEGYHSLIFFESVAEFENCDKYHDAFKKHSDEDAIKDMCKQSYQLAKGLRKKYSQMKIAMRLIYLEILIITIMFGIIIIG